MSYKDNLKRNLDFLMKKHNVTNDLLAERVGISRSSINRIRMNQGNPTVETLLAISEYFKVSLQDLAGSLNIESSTSLLEENGKIKYLPLNGSRIPIVEWENACHFFNSEMFLNTNKNSDSYALITSKEYVNIPKNSILILSKSTKPSHGDFLVVQEKSNSILNIAEYIQDISGEYIKSCLAEKPGLIDIQFVSLEKFNVMGTVLESRKIFISAKEYETY